MLLRLRLSVLIFLCFLVGCSTAKNSVAKIESLPATALKPFGRTVINSEGELALISSAAHVGFSFEGEECLLSVSLPSWLQHNYLQYEIDGKYGRRIRVSAKDTVLQIQAATGGRHTVWIYKATEAHTGPVNIKNIRAKNITPLQRPAAPLIEFIGNSITCGAAADPSEVPCGTGSYHDQHNAYMAYGPRVARALGANYFLSSVSGIGVYRNWNSEGPTMPQVYEKLDFQEKAQQRWNFSVYSPKVVSIALGTNDFSRGDGQKERQPFDSARFVSGYTTFVKTVKAYYPAAQIVLLGSPMISGESGMLLQNCLTAVKRNVDAANSLAKPIAVFFFRPMQARGCTGHPNVEDHEIMARQLIPFFKSLL